MMKKLLIRYRDQRGKPTSFCQAAVRLRLTGAQMEHILITGGAGFIGRFVVDELLARGNRFGCSIP